MTILNKDSQDTKLTARMIMCKEFSKFTDLLEPLYLLSTKKLSFEDSFKILDEWEERINGLKSADNLTKKWQVISSGYRNFDLDEMSDIAFRWLNLLASFGISRDSKNEIQINETTQEAYDESNNDVLVIGKHMIVEKGAWFLNNKIILKGVLVNKGENLYEKSI